MRDIKFKAWHTSQKKMYSAETLANDQLTLLSTGKFINVSSKSVQGSIIYDSMIPLEYIGAKDKNAVEIYEGDIVRFTDCEDCSTENGNDFNEIIAIGQVVWDKDELRWDVSNREQVELPDVFCYDPDPLVPPSFVIKDDFIEVIGNIYENPELLTGE